MADVHCEGCGHSWPKPLLMVGRCRVTRCSFCPPKEPSSAPDLHTQLEDLLNEVGRDEENWRRDDILDLSK